MAKIASRFAVLCRVVDELAWRDDVLYSGTVAAAMEGRFLGIPSSLLGVHHGQLFLALGFGGDGVEEVVPGRRQLRGGDRT